MPMTCPVLQTSSRIAPWPWRLHCVLVLKQWPKTIVRHINVDNKSSGSTARNFLDWSCSWIGVSRHDKVGAKTSCAVTERRGTLIQQSSSSFIDNRCCVLLSTSITILCSGYERRYQWLRRSLSPFVETTRSCMFRGRKDVSLQSKTVIGPKNDLVLRGLIAATNTRVWITTRCLWWLLLVGNRISAGDGTANTSKKNWDMKT